MSIVCIFQIVFIRSSTDRHLIGFHLLAIENGTVVSTECNVSSKSFFSVLLGKYPDVELLDQTVVVFLILEGLACTEVVPIYNPTNSVQGFQFHVGHF